MATQLDPGNTPEKKDTQKVERDLLERLKKRFTFMFDADHENRLAAMDDLKFMTVPGYQWEDNMKQERGKRPCYEFNKLRITAKRIINDMRSNRPAGKIRAVEGGDKDVAEIYEGLVRNIWNVSDGETVTDYACDYQVSAGMTAWRIDTEYADDSAFDQDITIKTIENPFCLYVDPACRDPLKRDAEDWILTEKIPYKSFEKRYPDEDKANFDDIAEFDDDQDWQDEESVRIAEYWYKVPHQKEVWQLDDGTVVDSESDEGEAMAKDPEFKARITKTREVMTHKIMWCIASGAGIIEGPTEWAGSKFPFVMVFGEFIVVDGRPYWWGITRFAKDAQRSYNVARTAVTETIAQAPKSQWWSTTKQAEGLTDQWTDAHKKNYPFMLYNADPQAPGAPQRMGGPDIPVALMHELELASEEIKAVTGIFDASMGMTSNEKSGRAIYARQQQGEIATFNYRDNMAKGIQLTYELLIDLIPHIYDTERELRILGNDDAEDYVKVNQVVFDPETGQTLRINDLNTGRYDVTITSGPGFETQRQEAAETYGQMAQQSPEIMQVAGDLIFKSMDLPYSEEIGERMQTLLPPQIQQSLNNEQDMPPEVMQMMQQADMAMQQVQEQAAMVQQGMSEIEGGKAELEKTKAEIKTEVANVRAARAEFDAHVAQEMSKLIQKEAGITGSGAELTKRAAEIKESAVNLGRQEVGKVVDTASALEIITNLDQILAQFMGQVDQAVVGIESHAQQLDQRTNRVPVGGTVNRDGGRLTANVQFDDGTEKNISAERSGGQLNIVPDSGA